VKKGQLPEDLENAARQLYRHYTSFRAQQKVMEGVVPPTMPKGHDWVHKPAPALANIKNTKKKENHSAPEPFEGD
jgi:hypothetical protein